MTVDDAIAQLINLRKFHDCGQWDLCIGTPSAKGESMYADEITELNIEHTDNLGKVDGRGRNTVVVLYA